MEFTSLTEKALAVAYVWVSRAGALSSYDLFELVRTYKPRLFSSLGPSCS